MAASSVARGSRPPVSTRQNPTIAIRGSSRWSQRFAPMYIASHPYIGARKTTTVRNVRPTLVVAASLSVMRPGPISRPRPSLTAKIAATIPEKMFESTVKYLNAPTPDERSRPPSLPQPNMIWQVASAVPTAMAILLQRRALCLS